MTIIVVSSALIAAPGVFKVAFGVVVEEVQEPCWGATGQSSGACVLFRVASA